MEEWLDKRIWMWVSVVHVQMQLQLEPWHHIWILFLVDYVLFVHLLLEGWVGVIIALLMSVSYKFCP